MTAFDNIKVNNWPATSNDFEDFLVLKMPLNDQDIIDGKLAHYCWQPGVISKKTFTNTSVTSLESGTVYSTEGTQTGSDWGAGHEITGAFRKGSFYILRQEQVHLLRVILLLDTPFLHQLLLLTM